MFNLTGKVAVVTGAFQGVGYATAKRLSDAGAKVVMADLNSGIIEKAKELNCLPVIVDVSKEEEVKGLFEIAYSNYGKIDIVVNNAGITLPEIGLQDTNIKVLQKVTEVNLYSVFWALKYAPALMNDGGSIINMASLGAINGFPGYGPYSASKGGVIALTQVAAMELAPRNIRVNCINPGTIDTPMAHLEGNENELKLLKYHNPMARMCLPEEVAALIHFLAADDCRFVSAASISIDGGESRGIGINRLMKMISD